MKKILVIVLLFSFSIPLFCNAQKAVEGEGEIDTTALPTFAPTTQDEFDYLVRHFKNQAPGTVKLGYHVSNFGSHISSDRTYEFQFNYLVREASKEDPIAAIFVIAKSVSWNNVYYLCIPYNNPELNKLYKAQINYWDAPMRLAYAMALSEILIHNQKNMMLFANLVADK